MSKTEPYYIVALREPGTAGPAQAYVICKTVSVVERKAQKGGPGRPGASDNIATYLDGQFAHGATDAKYEAIGWGNEPIFDGSKATALFLGTANQE